MPMQQGYGQMPVQQGYGQMPVQQGYGQMPMQPAVVFLIAIPEIYSTFSFQSPTKGTWEMNSEHVSGDYFGFDPLGLKPTNAAELKEMQTKELNNGRLAMIAIAGMVVQEGISGSKLF